MPRFQYDRVPWHLQIDGRHRETCGLYGPSHTDLAAEFAGYPKATRRNGPAERDRHPDLARLHDREKLIRSPRTTTTISTGSAFRRRSRVAGTPALTQETS